MSTLLRSCTSEGAQLALHGFTHVSRYRNYASELAGVPTGALRREVERADAYMRRQSSRDNRVCGALQRIRSVDVGRAGGTLSADLRRAGIGCDAGLPGRTRVLAAQPLRAVVSRRIRRHAEPARSFRPHDRRGRWTDHSSDAALGQRGAGRVSRVSRVVRTAAGPHVAVERFGRSAAAALDARCESR